MKVVNKSYLLYYLAIVPALRAFNPFNTNKMSLDESMKRVYKKRSPLCRLCLQEYPKKLMNEIFGKEAGCKKDIQAAVGLKVFNWMFHLKTIICNVHIFLNLFCSSTEAIKR